MIESEFSNLKNWNFFEKMKTSVTVHKLKEKFAKFLWKSS